MEVILAESAGFCFGVKRAVDKVYEQIASGKKDLYPMVRLYTMNLSCRIWKKGSAGD